MTHTELLALFRKGVGNPITSDVADATLTGHLNRAYYYITDRYRFTKLLVRTTIPTVIGTQSYTLPSTTTTLLQLWNKTYMYKLRKVDATIVNVYDDANSPSPRSGRPLRYYHTDLTTIYVMPKPDAVYTLEAITKAKPAALVNGSDVPVIPENWHEGIVYYAKFLYFNDEKMDYPKAQNAYSFWQQWVQTKPSEHDEESVELLDGVDFMPNTNQSAYGGFDYE